MHERLPNLNFSLQHAADELGFSLSHLRFIFRESTDWTLSDYLTEMRLQRAAELLTATKAPVTEIATKVGLASPGHFYNMFKRRFGMTPNEYRRGKYPQG